jgi:hypothetical protein
MNTKTALEITSKWVNDRRQAEALAGRLAGLIPEPDGWALIEEELRKPLLSLTGRSLFVVVFTSDDDLVSVQRAMVTDDGDTQISVSDGGLGPRGQWDRHWTFRFLKRSADFPPLEFTTTPALRQLPPPDLEALARKVAVLAGWPVEDQQTIIRRRGV